MIYFDALSVSIVSNLVAWDEGNSSQVGSFEQWRRGLSALLD